MKQAEQLREAIKRNRYPDTCLPDLAFTLQTGRDAMPERMGMIVKSMNELEEKLKAFCQGKNNIPGLYRGRVPKHESTLMTFLSIDTWIAKNKYHSLLKMWVQGLPVDWEKLYKHKKPIRMSLPTYPFEKRRCWIQIGRPSLLNLETPNAHDPEEPIQNDITPRRIIAIVAQVLGLDEDEIKLDLSLSEIGFDSIHMNNGVKTCRIFI